MPRCVSVGTSSLPGNVSVVGFTGNAAGQKLTRLRWTYEARLYNATEQLDACTSAALLCQQMPRCDTVELFQPNVGYMKGTPEAPLAHTDAIFRASFKQWLDHKPAPLRGTISNHGPLRRLTPMLCKELADRARLVRPGTRSPMRSRQMWEQSFCEEYAATADQPLPALGNDAPPVRRAASTSIAQSRRRRVRRRVTTSTSCVRQQGVSVVLPILAHPGMPQRAGRDSDRLAARHRLYSARSCLLLYRQDLRASVPTLLHAARLSGSTHL